MAKRTPKKKSTSSSQTNKARYPSKYSDNYVTLPQYLAELMCERRAANLKIELPRFFWNTLQLWKQYYFYQLGIANRLVKQYDPGLILRAINELKYIYSLNIKKLIVLIKEYEKEPAKLVEEVVQPIETTHPSGVFIRKKGALGKLDE